MDGCDIDINETALISICYFVIYVNFDNSAIQILLKDAN